MKETRPPADFQPAATGREPDSYDSPWKEMAEKYLPELLELFFRDVYAGIDWSRPYESLDKELARVVRDARIGQRLADKLFRVYRRDGRQEIVHLHLEVQGEREAAFPRRLFTYFYRIFDYRDGPVVSLAVFADDDPDWCPDHYETETWGCRVLFEYPTVKLWDYNERWAELERSSNPFAVVVMAHLKTKATRHAPEERLRWKMRFVRSLYESDYLRQDVLRLFWFIDWVMHLPEPLDRRFKDEIDRYEEETKMRYVTSVERLSRAEGRNEGREEGLAEGLAEGVRQGEASILERLLRRRFVELPRWVSERLDRATREELALWSDRLLDARRLEEVFAVRD